MSMEQASAFTAKLRADADKLIKRADAIDGFMGGLSTGATLRFPLGVHGSIFACAVLNDNDMWAVSGEEYNKTTDGLLAWLQDIGIDFDQVILLMRGLTS